MIKPFKLRAPNKKINEIYNKVKKYPWHEMPKGGHFAALEQPDLLVNDIRAFARTLS